MGDKLTLQRNGREFVSKTRKVIPPTSQVKLFLVREHTQLIVNFRKPSHLVLDFAR